MASAHLLFLDEALGVTPVSRHNQTTDLQDRWEGSLWALGQVISTLEVVARTIRVFVWGRGMYALRRTKRFERALGDFAPATLLQ